MPRVGQKLGKYKLQAKVSEGAFAVVYRALDTLEGQPVALKLPHAEHLNGEALDAFTREVRLAARLEHPNILGLKNADFIDGQLVLAFALGKESLEDRLARRMSLATALDLGEQLLEALAFAHEHKVLHCDVKPDNLLLFDDGVLRLMDFGISRVAQRTVSGSGAGTVGYMAPEQAMGKPSIRSDVFAAGLVLWRMFSGELPDWPFDWPLPGHKRLKIQLHADMVKVLRKALEVKPARRYADGGKMLAAYQRARPKANRLATVRTRKLTQATTTRRDWTEVRQRQFKKDFGKLLATRLECTACDGPVSEFMIACPWCGADRAVMHDDPQKFPTTCPRCRRGMKHDWTYCPWCFGPGFEIQTDRQYRDARYAARCSNKKCKRRDLMPWMRYCPWCKKKVSKRWKIEGSTDKCSQCGWGVVGNYWSYCPWCAAGLT